MQNSARWHELARLLHDSMPNKSSKTSVNLLMIGQSRLKANVGSSYCSCVIGNSAAVFIETCRGSIYQTFMIGQLTASVAFKLIPSAPDSQVLIWPKQRRIDHTVEIGASTIPDALARTSAKWEPCSLWTMLSAACSLSNTDSFQQHKLPLSNSKGQSF